MSSRLQQNYQKLGKSIKERESFKGLIHPIVVNIYEKPIKFHYVLDSLEQEGMLTS